MKPPVPNAPILAIAGLLVAAPVSTPCAATISLDGYQRLGAVTFAGSGNPGIGSGRTWSFSGFDFMAFDQL